MNDAIREQISAFVDGELTDNESELLLRQLGESEALRAEAARYLSMGSCLRGDPALPALRNSVAAVIAGEPALQVEAMPAAAVPGRFLRPVVGVAVAASVAVMALVGLRQLEPGVDLPAAVSDDLLAVAIDAELLSTEPPVDEFLSDRPSDMLTRYYLSHGQSSANLGSRLVGLEVREGRVISAVPSGDAVGERSTDAAEAGAGQDSAESAQ